MEPLDLPEELNVPPETRMVGTLITKRPHVSSLLVSAGTALFIILFTQMYWLDLFSLADSLPAIHSNVFDKGEIWRLFTATLIHSDIGHLGSNLYMLSILGYFVYGYFGASLYPLWTFLGAGFVNLLSIYTYSPNVRLLGASGWVYLLGGFWLTLYLLIQRQYSLSSRALRVFGISLMVFFPTSFEPTTSYRTHFIGFVVGIAMALIYFRRHKKEIRKHESFRIVY